MSAATFRKNLQAYLQFLYNVLARVDNDDCRERVWTNMVLMDRALTALFDKSASPPSGVHTDPPSSSNGYHTEPPGTPLEIAIQQLPDDFSDKLVLEQLSLSHRNAFSVPAELLQAPQITNFNDWMGPDCSQCKMLLEATPINALRVKTLATPDVRQTVAKNLAEDFRLLAICTIQCNSPLAFFNYGDMWRLYAPTDFRPSDLQDILPNYWCAVADFVSDFLTMELFLVKNQGSDPLNLAKTIAQAVHILKEEKKIKMIVTSTSLMTYIEKNVLPTDMSNAAIYEASTVIDIPKPSYRTAFLNNPELKADFKTFMFVANVKDSEQFKMPLAMEYLKLYFSLWERLGSPPEKFNYLQGFASKLLEMDHLHRFKPKPPPEETTPQTPTRKPNKLSEYLGQDFDMATQQPFQIQQGHSNLASLKEVYAKTATDAFTQFKKDQIAQKTKKRLSMNGGGMPPRSQTITTKVSKSNGVGSPRGPNADSSATQPPNSSPNQLDNLNPLPLSTSHQPLGSGDKSSKSNSLFSSTRWPNLRQKLAQPSNGDTLLGQGEHSVSHPDSSDHSLSTSDPKKPQSNDLNGDEFPPSQDENLPFPQPQSDGGGLLPSPGQNPRSSLSGHDMNHFQRDGPSKKRPLSVKLPSWLKQPPP